MKKTKNLDSIFKVVFHVMCLCIVTWLIVDCTFKYLEDTDFTIVEYKKFGSNAIDIYPSFTYCFKWPILGPWYKVWKEFGNDDTGAIRNEYQNYLLGKTFEDDKFGGADYDQLSKNLENFLHKIEAGLVGNGVVQWSFGNGKLKLAKSFKRFVNEKFEKVTQNFSSEEMKGMPTPTFYISHRGIQEKCYTFDIPWIRNKQINRFRLYIEPEMLPGVNIKNNNTIKPILHQTRKDFSIAFHYPHQTFKSLSTASGFTSSIDTSQNYLRKYFLANIEVLRRRNKPSKPCINGEYDKEIIQRTIEAIGCKPPTIKLGDNVTSVCNNETTPQFQNALFNNYHPPPCEIIQSISEFHGESDETDWLMTTNYKGKLMLEVHILNEYYKEMVYRKEYTLESLIGNAGGYIGK